MQLLKDYCETSTLHGFSYLAQQNRSRFEKLLWALMLMISIVITTVLLFQLMEKVKSNPIVAFTSDVAMKITDIHFPAFIYCVPLKPAKDMISYDYALELATLERNLTQKEHDDLMNFNVWALALENGLEFVNVSKPVNSKSLWLLRNTERRTFINANWMKLYSVDVYTNYLKRGKCQVFNAGRFSRLVHESISQSVLWPSSVQAFNMEMEQDNIYLSHQGIDPPYNATHKDLGLEMEIFEGILMEWRPMVYENFGYDVGFHNPYEVPDETSLTFTVSLNQTYLFLIEPQLTTIDESLIHMPPLERNCYLPHEKELKIFREYNERNCKAECLLTRIWDECQCYPFYFPFTQDFAEYCELKERKCYEKVEANFPKHEQGCGCLKDCNRLHYDYEVRKNHFVSNNFIDRNHWWNENRLKAKFKIVFKDEDFFPLVRRASNTEADILSFAGGLLGLFLGLSVLSAFEIIYFLTLHLFYLILKQQKKLKLTFKFEVMIKFSINIPFLKRFLRFMNHFLESSSIHGLAYLVSKKSFMVGRMAWMTAFGFSIFGCVYMMNELNQQRGTKSLQMVLSDKILSVSTIPFPAITIFGSYPKQPSFVRRWNEKIYPLFDGPVMLNEKDIELFRLYHMELILDDNINEVIQYIPSYNFTGYRDLMIPTMKNFSQAAWFHDQSATWNKIFKVPFTESLTSRGIGFSFNQMAAEDIYRVDQVTEDFVEQETFTLNGGQQDFSSNLPWHSSTRNSMLQLEITSQNATNLSLYKAFSLHDPYEPALSLTKDETIEFDGGKKIEILVTPKVIVNDPNMIGFEIQDRLCYFEPERRLRFFKRYSVKNCQHECISNITAIECGCVPFDNIRDPETPICELHELLCVQNLRYRLKVEPNSETMNACNCLQSCNSITYDFEIIETRFGDINSNLTIFNVKFKNDDFSPLRRYEDFTSVDFLCGVGGLLGLFAGISVLSLFELLYFFGPRLFNDVVRNRNHKVDISLVNTGKWI